MTDSKNYFSTASDEYHQFRPGYPPALFDYLAQRAPARRWAWDCGCGNGQATIALASRFAQVSATDISAAQITQAEVRDNIDYRVSPADIIAAPDNSLDLITVAQAIHWFDHSRFFAELERSLKPGGILAAWGYQLLYSDSPLDAYIEIFNRDIVGPYWPQGRELLDEGYTKISFPYPREKTPTFYMREKWSFGQLLGYLNTWSAVKGYQEARGLNPVEEHLSELRTAWGNEQQIRDIHWPLILYVGSKPIN